jgi:tetratricopeptide (TPR) repeat protein
LPRSWKVFALLILGTLAPAQTPFATLAKQASVARAANRLDEAATLYRKALALRPTWAEGWFSLGTIQYDQNSYQAAALSFGKAARFAKSGTTRVMLGLCEFELGQNGAALRHLQEGIALGIADDEQLRNVAIFHEGVLLQRAGKFEDALQTMSALCATDVDSNTLDTTIGLAALRLRDRTTSEPVIAKIGHAECLGDAKQFDHARREYDALVQTYPQFVNLHYAYGRFLLNSTQDPEAAIAQFRQEIKNQPNSALPRLQIAAAQYKVDSNAGLPYAEEAVKLDPHLPLGHYILGLLLLDTGQNERALSELETAQKAFPNESGVYYALANAFAHVGRTQDAAQARATFLRLRKQASVSVLPQFEPAR